MLNWFRLEILNPKGLESSIVYVRQCSSVIESPAVVTVSLSKANPISSYPMVKTGLQFFPFHVECKYNTGISICVYYWGCHLGQTFGRAITKVTFGDFRSSWKPASLPGRSVGKGKRQPWEWGWLKMWKCRVKMSKMSNHQIHLLSAHPYPPPPHCSTATSKLMR